MAETMATRQAYGKTLIELGEKYPQLVVMDAAEREPPGCPDPALWIALMIPHLISAAVFSNDLMSITSSIFIWYVILHNKYKPLQRELQGLSANSSEKGMLIDSQTDAQSFIYLR